jgi:colicin import membrane protein
MKAAAVAVWVVLTWLSSGIPALAYAQSSEAAFGDMRARIARERADAEARFSERERECRTRFIVTACVDDAKRERREVIARLRREQNALDEQQRKEKAAERADLIRRKAENEAAREKPAAEADRREPARQKPARSASAPEAADRSMDAASAPRRSRPKGPLLPSIAPKSAARSAEEMARSRATFDAAQRAAAAHRAEVEARSAARAAKRKPAAPLPLPPGASAP